MCIGPTERTRSRSACKRANKEPAEASEFTRIDAKHARELVTRENGAGSLRPAKESFGVNECSLMRTSCF